MGNKLGLDAAFTVMTILNLIKDPLRSLPEFIGQFLEFQVSMSRIQEFIHVDEVNRSMIKCVSSEYTQDSVIIKPGSNFHWGTMTQKEKIQEAKIMRANDSKKNAKKNKTSIPSRLPAEPQIQTFDDFLTLKDIGINIKKGEFVCIIGDVGSGKSSLLNAINGEMIYAS